jgi:H+/Cl- antiporter ClcA
MRDGTKPPESAEKSLGDVVGEVSEKASLLVREEIELAKAEVKEKVSSLARGAGVGIAAGVFLVFAFVMFLQALAWFINDLLDVTNAIWAGFAIVTGLLILFAALAGYLALRWLRKGAPPTPDLAIEEAKRTREELEEKVSA